MHCVLCATYLFLRPLMKKKLEQGITLVVDRYAFSGAAFTSAKPVSLVPALHTALFHPWEHVSELVRSACHVCLLLRAQGFSLDWCMNPDMGLPKPDVVMFLQLSPTEAALRGQFGEERYENSVFQRAVLQKFEQLMKDPSVNWKVWEVSRFDLWIYPSLCYFSQWKLNTVWLKLLWLYLSQVIDAAQDVEDVHMNIKNHSLKAITTAESQPLGELWQWTLTKVGFFFLFFLI